MPHSDIHKQKRRKNYILLAIIFGFCLVVFIMTMVKMAHSNGIPDKYKTARKTHQAEIEKLEKEYYEKGIIHQKDIEKSAESWWYGDEMSDQAKEIKAVKEGSRLDWESDEDYAERMAIFEQATDDNSKNGNNED